MSAFRYMLDTNVLIDARKRRHPVAGRFSELKPGEAAQSAITYGELSLGAQKSERKDEAQQLLRQAAAMVPVLELTAEVAEVYGKVRAELERRGELIGGNDMWIAAHALAARLVLVTNNEREFRRITGLPVENWTMSSS